MNACICWNKEDIFINHIDVDTPETAKARVDLRVRKVGHGFPQLLVI